MDRAPIHHLSPSFEYFMFILGLCLVSDRGQGNAGGGLKKGQDFGGDNYMKIYTDLYCRNGHDPVMPSLWPSYSHLTGIPAKKRVPATGSSPSVCGLSHDCQLYSQPGEFRGTVLFFCCRKSLLYL